MAEKKKKSKSKKPDESKALENFADVSENELENSAVNQHVSAEEQTAEQIDDGIIEIAPKDVTDSKLRQLLGEGLDPDEEREIALASRRMMINAWHARNDLYIELFGPPTRVMPENYGPPSAEIVSDLPEGADSVKKFDAGGSGDPGDPDPSDQHLAILTYGPDPQRPYWTYVTAGLSTPWLQERPDEVSGFGCELIIKSPVDAQWPAQILQSMALHIFNHSGVLSPGKRLALNAPIAPYTDSALRNLFVWYPDEAPDCWYQIPSGGFGLFVAVGITDEELKYCESVDEYGTWCMQEVLRYAGLGQVTDPKRKSVMDMPNIDEVLANLKTFSDKFRASE